MYRADYKIFENFNAGTDTERAKIGYALGENIENLVLEESSTNAYGYGNALDNVLRGNATNNVLIGGVGYDTVLAAPAPTLSSSRPLEKPRPWAMGSPTTSPISPRRRATGSISRQSMRT
jgi:Ca2+-binding RTX toxin-like protein